MATTLNSLIIAFFDGYGEEVTPTANFTPDDDHPLSNLTNSQLFSRTRSTDLTDAQLTWDFGSGIEANCFGLFGTNATLETLRRFRAADNSGFSSGVVESGSTLTAAFDTSIPYRAIYTPPWGRSLIYIHPTSFSKRYVRWHQTDDDNPDEYQEWGIARLGLGLQFEGGFESWRAVPKTIGAPGAERVLRGHELTLHNLSRDEAYNLQSLALTLLSTRRILVIPEALNTDTYIYDALWCVLESSYIREPIANLSFGRNRYRVQMTFREVDR